MKNRKKKKKQFRFQKSKNKTLILFSFSKIQETLNSQKMPRRWAERGPEVDRNSSVYGGYVPSGGDDKLKTSEAHNPRQGSEAGQKEIKIKQRYGHYTTRSTQRRQTREEKNPRRRKCFERKKKLLFVLKFL